MPLLVMMKVQVGRKEIYNIASKLTECLLAKIKRSVIIELLKIN